MRLYYVIRDTSPVKLDRQQRQQQDDNLRLQAFAAAVVARRSGPNEQLEAQKISLTGEYRLGGIDLDNAALLAVLDAELRKIDARFSQVPRQLEQVLLAELRAALPQGEQPRSAQLSVQVIASGEREAAISAVQSYLRANAANWY